MKLWKSWKITSSRNSFVRVLNLVWSTSHDELEDSETDKKG